MRLLIGLILTFSFLLAAGCGPAVPKEDLGTVSHQMPEVPGAEEPYKMPELDEPASAEPEPVESSETPD